MMDELSSLHVHQGSGIASNGSQSINVTNNINKYPIVLRNLVKTHNGAIVFDPNLLRDVILEIDDISDKLDQKPKDFKSISIEEKNVINGMSQEFYNEIIARDYEPFFTELDVFLKKRENEDLHKAIGNIVKSLNKKFLASRSKFDSFESLLLSVEEALLENKYDSLKNKEESISLFLFFLYTDCYIGKKSDIEC